MKWLNEPQHWQADDQSVTMTAEKDTDFWRVTRHGYIKDDGHFYYQDVSGDFSATVKVSGKYVTLYDQAGVMVRADSKNWLKCGIEYIEGTQQISTVVTRDFSDWAFAPLAENPPSIWLRLQRIAETIEVSYSLDGQTFTMIRQAYLTDAPSLQVGLMCAAPRGDGFQVTFEQFSLE